MSNEPGETLTPEQAFLAMFYYLDDYWHRFENAERRDVLGDLQPAEAGSSSDAAAWDDWMQCVRRVADTRERW